MANSAPPQQNGSAQTPSYSQVAADHIQKLSEINEMIPSLLRISGTAVSQLTQRPVVHPASSRDAPDTPDARKLVIQQCSHDLFKKITQISNDLHDQIADLHTEKVIPATQIKYIPPVVGPNQTVEQRPRDSEAHVTNGGLGDLDVGVLNARAGVRQAGGDEVLDRVKGILEKMVEDGDEMVVDK